MVGLGGSTDQVQQHIVTRRLGKVRAEVGTGGTVNGEASVALLPSGQARGAPRPGRDEVGQALVENAAGTAAGRAEELGEFCITPNLRACRCTRTGRCAQGRSASMRT